MSIGESEVENMANVGIYRIVLGNGYFYIGSSSDLIGREKRHLYELREQKHGNTFLQNAYNKYGIFKFDVLSYCGVSQILSLEQDLLDIHMENKKCVNIALNAKSPMLGRKQSEETLRIMRSRRHTPEAIEKMRKSKIGNLSFTGKTHTFETKKKMGDSRRNFYNTNPEAKAKQLEYVTAANMAQSQVVTVITNDGTELRFKSQRDAAKQLYISLTTITHWFNNAHKPREDSKYKNWIFLKGHLLCQP